MSQQILAKYSFASWFRQGLATQISLPDELGPPSAESSGDTPNQLSLNLHLFGDDEETARAVVTKQLALIGPGEITGIERRAIIRTEPAYQANNFEYNYFPYIEFYDEDFPWRYTPLAPNGSRLRPWLALVVLKEEEFERLPFEGVLPTFSLKDGPENAVLPPPYQSWAWAHVHLNGQVYGQDQDAHEAAAADLARIIQLSPNRAHSRILCPRKLEPNTTYYAFLIPAFEKGRLAGLRAPKAIIDETAIQLASWGHAQDHFSGYLSFQNKWPIYYQWQFKTGMEGENFETMARKIVPTTLKPEVGQQWIDIHSPGYGLKFNGGEEPNPGWVKMAGALLPPEAEESDFLEPHPENIDHTAFLESLAELINLNEVLKEESSTEDDPIVSPTLYGRWHALQAAVVPTDRQEWINQLNLDPRRRIAAGLGAEVIRRKQDAYMDRAWGQFGELFEVNEQLRKARFMMKVNEHLYHKHLTTLPAAQLTSVTAGMHGVIRNQSTTIRGLIKSKAIPNAMMTLSYNKITRPKGTLMRRTAGSSNSVADNVGSIGIASTKKISVPEPTQDAGGLIFPPIHPLDALVDLVAGKVNANFSSGRIALFKWLGIDDFKQFATNLSRYTLYFHYDRWEKQDTQQALNLDEIKPNLLHAINPPATFLRKMSAQLSTDPEVIKDENEELVSQILAAPTFPDPMYEEMLNISDEFFLPKLELIPENASAIMKLNQPFIEAYLVGLNHEMARELLWREFPTDQRGSYFEKFWDARDRPGQLPYVDISSIHSWGKTPLGDHLGMNNETQPLVFVLRADLIRRYPDLIIHMSKAKKKTLASGQSIREPDEEKTLYPLFHAKIAADMLCLGFDIGVEEARSDPGWFFILKQRPGSVQFGMDIPDPVDGSVPTLNTWDDLNWGHLPSTLHYVDIENDRPQQPDNDEEIAWGETAAHMAWITYQKPFQLALHAKSLLPEQNPES